MTGPARLGKSVELQDWLRSFRHDGLRRSRPFVIGATGHLLLSPAEQDNVTHHLERGLLPRLISTDGGLKIRVLTGLAPGADLLLTRVVTRWLARRGMAYELIGLLPVPPARLLRDWEEKSVESGAHPDEAQLHKTQLELRKALRECDVLVDLLPDDSVRTRLDDVTVRQTQYRRLAALLAEQTDVLIAVLRGRSAELPGGTAEVVEWRRSPQSVPPEFSTLSVEQRVAGERNRQLIVVDPGQVYTGAPPARDAAEGIHRKATDALKAGNYLQCYDVITRARARGIDSRPLQYLTVLALANAGSTRLALRTYVEFEEVGDVEEDWLALKARLLKDLAFRGGPQSESLFLEAAESYEAAYQRTRGHFSGINAATMYCLAGKRQRARELAVEVSALLQKLQPRTDEERYYWQVTQAEAALLLGHVEPCKIALRAADRYEPSNINARSRTRFQLRQLAVCLGKDPGIADALALPPALYVRRLGTATMESGLEPQPELVERIAHRKPLVFLPLLGMPELRAAEICLDLGVPLYLSLPDERSNVVARWRKLHGDETVERLARCLLGAHEVCCARGFLDGEDSWCERYVESMAFGLSLLTARRLATDWNVMAISLSGRALRIIEQAPENDPSLTVTGEFTHGVMPARRRYVGLIFADFVGFSGLSDDLLPSYWNDVMGAVAQTVKKHGDQILFRHTWGDALHVVTRNALAAAVIATDIRAALEELRPKLSGDLSRLELRLSIHYAPAFIGRDPVEDADTFFGSQLSFAARIEPVTPPGAIFVTESFAARLMLEGPEPFALEYAGEVELAKNFGQYRLFSLRKKNLADFGKTAELLVR